MLPLIVKCSNELTRVAEWSVILVGWIIENSRLPCCLKTHLWVCVFQNSADQYQNHPSKCNTCFLEITIFYVAVGFTIDFNP